MTEKTNLKTLVAGTTTLLMGLNVFVSPVKAAANQSEAALGKEAIAAQQQEKSPGTVSGQKASQGDSGSNNNLADSDKGQQGREVDKEAGSKVDASEKEEEKTKKY